MKLLFIRHAQSTGNQAKRMMGQGEDELTEVGRRQAKDLGQRLQAESGLPSHVYSSPAQRSRQTVEILLAQWENIPQSTLSITFTADLQEYHNGIFQGLTWTEAQQQYPDLCAALATSLDWIPIPGAETLQAGRDRAERFIRYVLDQHSDTEQIWIVSHSWILQQLISVLLGCDRTWGVSMANTALFEFWLNRDRWTQRDSSRLNTELWQIRRFNDIEHLTQGLRVE